MYQWLERPIIYARLSPKASRFFIGACIIMTGLLITTSAFFCYIQPENPLITDNRRAAVKGTYLGKKRVKSRDAKPSGTGRYFGIRRPGREDILLIGDSHAKMLKTGLNKFALKHKLKIRLWARNGSPPIFGVNIGEHYYRKKGPSKDFDKVNRAIEQYIVKHKPPVVMLCARWALYTHETETYGMYRIFNKYILDAVSPEYTLRASQKQFSTKLNKTVETILAAGSKVIILGQVPELGNNPEQCRVVSNFVTQSQIDQRCASLPYTKTMNRLSFSNQIINELAAEKVLPLILSDVFCDKKKNQFHHMKGRMPLFYDHSHVNNLGSIAIINYIENDLVTFLGLSKK